MAIYFMYLEEEFKAVLTAGIKRGSFLCSIANGTAHYKP